MCGTNNYNIKRRVGETFRRVDLYNVISLAVLLYGHEVWLLHDERSRNDKTKVVFTQPKLGF